MSWEVEKTVFPLLRQQDISVDIEWDFEADEAWVATATVRWDDPFVGCPISHAEAFLDTKVGKDDVPLLYDVSAFDKVGMATSEWVEIEFNYRFSKASNNYADHGELEAHLAIYEGSGFSSEIALDQEEYPISEGVVSTIEAQSMGEGSDYRVETHYTPHEQYGEFSPTQLVMAHALGEEPFESNVERVRKRLAESYEDAVPIEDALDRSSWDEARAVADD